EYEMLGPLLGADDPEDIMEPFTLRDVAGIGGTLIFRLGYETGDIGQTRDVARFDTHFAGDPLETLRTDALWEIYSDQSPVFDEPSAFGYGARRRAIPDYRPTPPRVNDAMLQRHQERADRWQDRYGRDHEEGWGSNAWAVAGTHTADGRALLAGDGHLELDIPPLMMQIGLDTAHLGGGDIHQAGLVIAGMPILSVGTNGKVAWSNTQHSGDITDWYAEQIELGADGLPSGTVFQGETKPTVRFDEHIKIAGRLGSEERTDVWPRFETFDGRWITDVEGRSIGGPDDAEDGEAVLSVGGDWVVPGDEDGDGVITAISFDFAGLDKGNLFAQFDALGTAENVEEVHDAMRMGLALSQNIVAADSAGDIYYNGYQMVPCRGYLPRNSDGSWVDGADPRMLLDGTTYGGFTIPIDGDSFTAIEGDSDPSRCVIPFDDYPHAISPERGYVLTANQDPGGLVSDGSVLNDSIYIGGPWDDGYRADTIARGLQASIDAGTADIASMAELQGNHESVIARRHLDDLLGAIDNAAALTQRGVVSTHEERLLAVYSANQARFDEVALRLEAWQTRGLDAASGVETFYHPTVDDNEHDDAVATMIFNVWMADTMGRILNDEGVPGAAWQGGGSAGRLRALDTMFDSRGPNNPLGLDGYNATTEEHVFFDIRGTAQVEQSDEVVLLALQDSLNFLESAPTGDGTGGFGSTDMDTYVWGLRHQVRFGSLVGSYIDDPLFATVFNSFAITTDVLPLEDGMAPTDPRAELEWFPRPGDNRNIDAANPGFSGRRFTHGSGPVMRMVFAMGEESEGINVIPGGVSGRLESENFTDQTGLWLANEALPVPLGADQVAEQGLSRETYLPGTIPGTR
ncbi:MAG: penicillin acylase family protein, partial [Proteobacteria bacterium]|nr:penicillin acylase family protein [Pseudomonadota bacterium]